MYSISLSPAYRRLRQRPERPIHACKFKSVLALEALHQDATHVLRAEDHHSYRRAMVFHLRILLRYVFVRNESDGTMRRALKA